MKSTLKVIGRSARNRNLFRVTLLSCALGLVPQPVSTLFGQTWVAPIDGSWHDPTKWSGGDVPDDSTADALIDAQHPPVVPPDTLPLPYEIVLDVPTTIGSIVVNSTDAVLNHSDGTLTVSNLIDIKQGRYLLNGGTISGGQLRNNGNLFIEGTSVLSGVEVLDNLALRSSDFGRKLTLNNDTVLDQGVIFKSAVILNLNQDLSIAAGNSITTEAYGRIDISNGRTLTIDVGASIDAGRLDIYGLGNLVNNGLITSSGPTTLSISIANDNFTNNGTIQAGDEAVIEISSPNFHNTVTGKVIASDGGRVIIGDRFGSDAWSTDGLIQVADSTSTIELGGTFNNADLSHVENANGGRIQISGTWNNAGGHTFTADQGNMELTGGDVVGGHLTAGANGEFLKIVSGTLDGVQFNGDINIESGNYVVLRNGTTVSGSIQANSASVQLNQDFATTVGQSYNVTGSLFGQATLSVDGLHTLTVSEGTTLSVADAELRGDFVYDVDGLVGSSKLANEGTVQLQGSVNANISVENRGQFNVVDSGTSAHVRKLDNQSAGTVQIENGASLGITELVNNGAITLQGGSSKLSIQNLSSSSLAGIDNQVGGTLSVFGNWDNQDSYTFNSTTGSIYLSGMISGGSLTPGSNGEFLIMNGGVLNGVTVNGGLNVPFGGGALLSGNTQINGPIYVGSYLALNQDFTLADGQVMTLDGGEVRVLNEFHLTFDEGSVLQGNGTITSFSEGSIEINGTVGPGFSPGTIEFNSSVIFGSASNLEIELASQSLFDTILVHGDATLGGTLDVSLLNGFALQANQNFQFMSIDGLSSGMFAGLSQDGLVGSYNGFNLFIDYQAGDGNDVSLYAVAVPEPASLAALAACGAVYVGWRLRKSSRAVST